MPWQVQKDPEGSLIHIVYTGKITKQDVMDATEKALSLATGDNLHRFLADLTDAISELSLIEIHDIPDQWESLKANRRNPMAVIIPETAARTEDSQFYENVARNRGWDVRVFRDREKAIEWLSRS